MIHILNQRDSGSVLVHNLFALAVEKFVDARKSEVRAFTFGLPRHATKADRKRKSKMKISNASFENSLQERGKSIDLRNYTTAKCRRDIVGVNCVKDSHGNPERKC